MTIEDQVDKIETILIRTMRDVDDDLADVWVYHRFTAEDVEAYIELGVIDPDVAAILDDAGLTHRRLRRLIAKIQESRK